MQVVLILTYWVWFIRMDNTISWNTTIIRAKMLLHMIFAPRARPRYTKTMFYLLAYYRLKNISQCEDIAEWPLCASGWYADKIKKIRVSVSVNPWTLLLQWKMITWFQTFWTEDYISLLALHHFPYPTHKLAMEYIRELGSSSSYIVVLMVYHIEDQIKVFAYLDRKKSRISPRKMPAM